ncbi:MAG: flavocytochrome c [Desulfuromusa sp.]|jgi:flavocytochrome c|nr:flavocytochrome c [Desulfuromusa sp.]
MKNKQQWHEEYDVVIIGSGFAGLAAAIEAKQTGSSVIVLEKMTIPGGNSAICGGLIAAAGSPLQEREGIKDTPELMFADMMKAGMGINHPALARIVAENSLEALRWTLSLGVEYKNNINHLGGHSVPRTYSTACGTGSGILQPLLTKCRELEIPIQLKTKFRHFIQTEDRCVEGVDVLQNYSIGHDDVGTPIAIRARKGVILACGGFGSDVSFRLVQDPRLTDVVDTTNQRGATAEGLISALQIGAIPVHLSWIQLGPWASFDEKGWGVGSIFTMLAGFPYGIMIDAKTGKRFVNEMSDRRLRTDAMLFNDRIPVAIVDSHGVQHATTLDKCLKRGVVQKFNTLEELATYNSIPRVELKETLERYRLSLLHGRDIEFGKPIAQDLKPIENPPFYSIRLLPKVHHCMGGVQINEHAQVNSLPEYQPIPNLYAAGEVTGGVHGASRLGSNAIVDCLVFGRIAGKSAAQA